MYARSATAGLSRRARALRSAARAALATDALSFVSQNQRSAENEKPKSWERIGPLHRSGRSDCARSAAAAWRTWSVVSTWSAHSAAAAHHHPAGGGVSSQGAAGVRVDGYAEGSRDEHPRVEAQQVRVENHLLPRRLAVDHLDAARASVDVDWRMGRRRAGGPIRFGESTELAGLSPVLRLERVPVQVPAIHRDHHARRSLPGAGDPEPEPG